MKVVIRAGARAPMLVVSSAFFAACARTAPAVESVPPAHAERGESAAGAAPDPLTVTGLLGSLSQAEIHNALDPRMPRFARCLGARSDVVPWLSGQLVMLFHIGLDGHASFVHPTSTDLGDRITERCLLDVAAATQFPAPHGGEAEFSWSLEAPADPDVRAPEAYAALDRALPTLSAAVTSCASGPMQVTGYVDENGAVVAAGAASREHVSRDALDCVSSALVGVTIVSPGSYAAKWSTVLP